MKVVIFLLLGIVLALAQSPSRSKTPTHSPVPSESPNPTNISYGFICQQINNYDFRTWQALGNFLPLDASSPANWTVTRSTAMVTPKLNGDPTALLSPDVWTGRVTFTGYMQSTGQGDARKLGFLFGVVSPRSKFLLLEWSNDANTQAGCVPPIVNTAWGRTQSGLVLRAIRNPLGQSTLQQECNMFSSVSQVNVTSILYTQPNIERREVATPYWFTLTMDTFNNSIYYEIHKSNSSGRIIANDSIYLQDHDLSGNFSLGRIGAYISGGAATFFNWTVTPETCHENYLANCGYFCPNYNTTMTYSEAPANGEDDEGSKEGLHWYAILLIILSILICCCLICVIIAAVVVFLRR